MVEQINYTKKYLRKTSQEISMILFTFDPIFKGIIERNLEVFKNF